MLVAVPRWGGGGGGGAIAPLWFSINFPPLLFGSSASVRIQSCIYTMIYTPTPCIVNLTHFWGRKNASESPPPPPSFKFSNGRFLQAWMWIQWIQKNWMNKTMNTWPNFEPLIIHSRPYDFFFFNNINQYSALSRGHLFLNMWHHFRLTHHWNCTENSFVSLSPWYINVYPDFHQVRDKMNMYVFLKELDQLFYWYPTKANTGKKSKYIWIFYIQIFYINTHTYRYFGREKYYKDVLYTSATNPRSPFSATSLFILSTVRPDKNTKW